MTTFSQLVDALVAETRRPDMIAEIISYANQTIRELHFNPDNNAAVFYKDNFFEQLLTPTVESGFGWDVPDPGTFQAMQVVHYTLRNVYPSERIPSRALANLQYYYYRTKGTYIFSGYSGLSDRIAIGYFAFPRRLMYYTPERRPAEYSPDIGWTYYSTFGASEVLREAGQGFVSNWLLFRWPDVVAEGIRAKIYKRVGDTDRARVCYSAYTALRNNVVTSETADLGGFS